MKEVETVSPARVVAITVLHRVAEEGAYASLALDAEIKRRQLRDRDARLATEIVYGSLRVMPELDREIARFFDRPRRRLDALTRAALRASGYQLLYLPRVPVYAAVNDAVSLLRDRRSDALAGFANAVLRRLADRRPPQPRPPQVMILPEWIMSWLEAALEPDRLHALVRSRPLPPPLCLRVNTERIDRERLARRIRQYAPRASVEFGAVSPLALVIRGGGDPRRLPGYEQGWFAVQEEGAQLVALSAGAREKERVADVCAGHGTKTALLAAAVGPRGRVTAIDIDENKLDRIHPELCRLGLEAARVTTVPVDLTVGVADLETAFDRVLVDAPCTGFGTIHRRPDLLLRADPGQADRLSQVQYAILSRAARLVRPGGWLLYAVCSPLRQEALCVAERLEAENSSFQRMISDDVPWLPPADPDGIRRIGPWLGGETPSSPDVYQVIHWLIA